MNWIQSFLAIYIPLVQLGITQKSDSLTVLFLCLSDAFDCSPQSSVCVRSIPHTGRIAWGLDMCVLLFDITNVVSGIVYGERTTEMSSLREKEGYSKGRCSIVFGAQDCACFIFKHPPSVGLGDVHQMKSINIPLITFKITSLIAVL